MAGTYGIGTDIVQVKRIAAGLDRFGDKFARRILADSEYQTYQHSARPIHFLAKRFAAKEAVLKALGLGMRDGLSFRQITVANNGMGKPQLSFTGRAEQYCAQQGIRTCHLSIADEQEYAIAFVTLET